MAITALSLVMALVGCSDDVCANIDRTIADEQTLPQYADAVVVADSVRVGTDDRLALPHLLSDLRIDAVLYADPAVPAAGSLAVGQTVTVDEYDCAPPTDLPTAEPGRPMIALPSGVESGSDVRVDWRAVYVLVEAADGSLRFLGSDGPAVDTQFADPLASGRIGFLEWLMAARR